MIPKLQINGIQIAIAYSSNVQRLLFNYLKKKKSWKFEIYPQCVFFLKLEKKKKLW